MAREDVGNGGGGGMCLAALRRPVERLFVLALTSALSLAMRHAVVLCVCVPLVPARLVTCLHVQPSVWVYIRS